MTKDEKRNSPCWLRGRMDMRSKGKLMKLTVGSDRMHSSLLGAYPLWWPGVDGGLKKDEEKEVLFF